jgi:hypothetical protein
VSNQTEKKKRQEPPQSLKVQGQLYARRVGMETEGVEE